MNTPFSSGTVALETVRFQSGSSNIAGLLFLPREEAKLHPAISILGPFGFVKEQAPVQYAIRLAHSGIAALVFDPRYHGESEGLPRRHESPEAKIADAMAALVFLRSHPSVDAKRIGALGICQGSSEMIALAAQEAQIKALAVVSGQYLYPENLDGFFAGGGITRLERIQRGQSALKKFQESGEVEYTQVVSLTDKNVGLPWKPIHDWYHPWTTDKWGQASRWENRYTTMSDAEVWNFNADAFTPLVTVPTLIIHGEMSDGGIPAAQHVFERLQMTEKQLITVPDVFHTRFYDDPVIVDPVAQEVAAWFQRYL